MKQKKPQRFYVIDRPRMETFPWSFVLGLGGIWLAVWTVVWIFVSAELAALINTFGSYTVPAYLPWILPLGALLFAFFLAWTSLDLRRNRRPTPFALYATVILAVAVPVAWAFVLNFSPDIMEFRPSRHPISKTAKFLVDEGYAFYIIAAFTAVLAAPLNVTLVRRDYMEEGVPAPRSIPWNWVAALALGWVVGGFTHHLVGALAFGVIGNALTINAYRKDMLRRLDEQNPHPIGDPDPPGQPPPD